MASSTSETEGYKPQLDRMCHNYKPPDNWVILIFNIGGISSAIDPFDQCYKLWQYIEKHLQHLQEIISVIQCRKDGAHTALDAMTNSKDFSEFESAAHKLGHEIDEASTMTKILLQHVEAVKEYFSDMEDVIRILTNFNQSDMF